MERLRFMKSLVNNQTGERTIMTVLDYLDNTAERLPEKEALIDDTESVSYRELCKRSDSIATALMRETKAECRPVVVFIDRNAASVCTFMGIVKTRNFYVPIDIGQPAERIRTILGKIRPALLISVHGNGPEGLGFEEIPRLEYDDAVLTPPDDESLRLRRTRMIDTDPLYAICTSGSTGTPKAVLISHRSVLDFIPVFTRTFSLTQNEIFGNQAPFDFDVSVKDLYSALYLGATIYIIPRVCFVMPKKLVEVLDDRKVTTIIWAVSALCIAAGVNAFKYRVPGNLRRIMFSGEVMPIKMLNVWRKYYPDAMFVNLYGPTEITCNCTYYIVDREFDVTEQLPLGIAFENEEVLVLNEKNVPVRTGETGEICVKGTCLALGYYGDPERTAQAFVQNPLQSAYPDMIYRTGDLAILQENGEYVFAARKDFQIKHMGHRIELEEVEAHLGAADGVSRASCLFDEKRQKIVGCYTGEATKEEIIDQMKEKLPKYMIPNIFLQLEEMPLTKNGKTDRRKLREEYDKLY